MQATRKQDKITLTITTKGDWDRIRHMAQFVSTLSFGSYDKELNEVFAFLPATKRKSIALTVSQLTSLAVVVETYGHYRFPLYALDPFGEAAKQLLLYRNTYVAWTAQDMRSLAQGHISGPVSLGIYGGEQQFQSTDYKGAVK